MDASPESPSPGGHRRGRTPVRWLVIAAVAGVAVIAAVVALTLPGGARPWTASAQTGGSATPTAVVDGSEAAVAAAGPGSAAAPAPAGPAAASSAAPPAKSAAAPVAVGGCGRKAGASPVVKVTQVRVGTSVTGYGGEGDTDPLPMAIAATPAGGSWLAWLGTDKKVHLGKLDCNDKLVGTPTSFAGIDLQDVQADSAGGVLLVTRAGSCHTGPLCGGESSPCNTMHMIGSTRPGIRSGNGRSPT